MQTPSVLLRVAAFAALLFASAERAAAQVSPVVVELFTSQG